MKKRLISFALMICLVFGMSISATAASKPIGVIIDGEELWFDVPPALIKDRTMVPMRFIFEALGADVAWDGQSRTITATKDWTEVKTTIGDRNIYINGARVTMDVAPVIVEGRTLVPVRFVSEALDCDVDWDGTTRTVYICTFDSYAHWPEDDYDDFYDDSYDYNDDYDYDYSYDNNYNHDYGYLDYNKSTAQSNNDNVGREDSSVHPPSVHQYIITFDPNGGDVFQSSKLVSEGGAYGALSTPWRYGYDFEGWFTSANGGTKITSDTPVNLDEHQTLYARWAAVPFTPGTVTIRYDANGGTGAPASHTVTSDSAGNASFSLSMTKPSRGGHTFIGWSRSIDEGGSISSPGQSFTSRCSPGTHTAYTFYAQWSTGGSSPAGGNASASSAPGTVDGRFMVTVPANYRVDCFSSPSASTRFTLISAKSSSYNIPCTKRTILSDGTTWYFFVSGDNKNCWFKYNDSMRVTLGWC